MKIKYYGHAAFQITTDGGIKIIIDPYQSGAFSGALAYGKITDEADVVLTSHDHDDHNYIGDIRGSFTKIGAAGEYETKGIRVRAVHTYHDQSKGSERGNNLIFAVEADGLTIIHAGDLGHVLDEETLSKIGGADVLLLPVGGFYTINAGEATKIMETMSPSITVPMHYKTAKCDFPIASVEDFTEGRVNVKKLSDAVLEITKATLPQQPEIVVLKHAL